MSNAANKLLLAAAGNAGEAVYVDDVFSTFLYTGTQAVGNVVDNGIDLDDEDGLVWMKNRDSHASGGHYLFDTVREADGPTGAGYLKTNATNAAPSGISDFSFNTGGSTGFTVGATVAWNASAINYASWTFRKQPGFFDIVTYTGNGANDRAISHNLGSTPGFIIIKSTSHSTDWVTYHRSYTYPQWIRLNSTDAQGTGYGDAFSSGNPPTSTTFTLGSGGFGDTNYNGRTYVAYLFAHDDQSFGENSDEAIIKCGSYTGNGNSDGPTIDLGFEPQWVMIKSSSTSSNWIMLDNIRGVVTGGLDEDLYANLTYASAPSVDFLEFTSTGFIPKNNTGDTNSQNQEYTYVAIRRPHKPASEFAATELFAIDQGDGTASVPDYTSGFPVDAAITKRTSSGNNGRMSSRLTGANYISPNLTHAETADGAATFDFMDGWGSDGTNRNTDEYAWMFRRAPGFFDVVAYTGTGGAVWHNHNLGVVPEMIICKGRDIAEYWNVFTTAGGTSSRLHLDEGSEYITNNASQYFPSLPTATQFRIGQNNEIGGSGYNYIAYLFASVDGISKLGTYTGTGSAQDIDCGFSAGARFVMIKRVDVAGYWIIWDSERGIVAGNDPYLFLNTTAAQVTNTDYIDPLSSGFTITSSAPTDNSDASMNKSGGTYFFYAIA